jgi:hypothetical protein
MLDQLTFSEIEAWQVSYELYFADLPGLFFLDRVVILEFFVSFLKDTS